MEPLNNVPDMPIDCAVPNQSTITEYLNNLRRRNLSPNTVRVRSIVLGAVGRDLAVPLIDATTADLRAALDARHLGPASTYAYTSHLHTFYAWAVREGRRDDNPTQNLERPKRDRLLPRPIRTDDLATGIAGADPQMRAWLTLAAYAGLRCAEIGSLDADDINLAERWLRVCGKGRIERRVPMHPRVAAELAACALATSGPIFRGDDGEPYTAKAVSRVVARHIRSCGIDSTAHTLRHWFATNLYGNCLDLRVVQEMMGHANPSTTAIYVDWSRDRAAAAVAAL